MRSQNISRLANRVNHPLPDVFQHTAGRPGVPMVGFLSRTRLDQTIEELPSNAVTEAANLVHPPPHNHQKVSNPLVLLLAAVTCSLQTSDALRG